MTEAEIKNKLQELLSLPAETEVVEFKEAKNDYDFNKLGKYFSALSNEANLKEKSSAWLVFGVNNNHQIIGSNYRINRKDLDHLKYEIAEKVNNRLTFIEIYELQMSECRVVMFQIPAAPQGIPVSFGGFYFGRDGESTGALNIQEIEQIRNQVNQSDWSALICPRASIHDLDNKAIEKARENFKNKNPKLAEELANWDNETFLNKAKITIDSKITNTAIILLGKAEAQHFISPAIAQISWILKDKDNIELDYEHFSTPLLLNTDIVLQKIRNLKYRYLPDNTLFPTEVTQYEPYVIREALHNCIAHQDYSMQNRINLVEFPEHLIFENAGSFLPVSIENVIEQDAPQRFYRNKFLCDAMVALNMIDTIGSGIKKMFIYQRNRFFPLPDYDLSKQDTVKLKIFGKIIDKNYTQLLINKTDLSLKTVILLDRVQKGKDITDDEANDLKKLKLIEGRRRNHYVASHIAAVTGEKARYIKNKAFDDEHYKKMITALIDKYGSASRKDIDELLLNKLSDVLSEKQKISKIGNLLTSLRTESIITNIGTFTKSKWIRKT